MMPLRHIRSTSAITQNSLGDRSTAASPSIDAMGVLALAAVAW
jgi:hypothetical protein